MPVQIALVELPRLLADLLIAAFRPEDDVRFEVVSGAPRPAPPAADAVIVAVEDPERMPWAHQLTRSTDPLLLGVRSDGRTAWIYELRPRPRALGPVGPEQIRTLVLERLACRDDS